MIDTPRLPASWSQALAGELAGDDLHDLLGFLTAERALGKIIYPPADQYFRALELTPLDQVRVVILGQDPYHGPGQAHGLCFSVAPGVRPPPSLGNIFKELKSDLGIAPARHGCLEHWARQGVLLLNSVLSVEQARPASHQNKGWEAFTDAVIAQVNARATPVVFLLWGNYAQKKARFVDTSRHHVIRSAHPSPLSAHQGFLGSRPFSQANRFLAAHGLTPIDWVLPPLDQAQMTLL